MRSITRLIVKACVHLWSHISPVQIKFQGLFPFKIKGRKTILNSIEQYKTCLQLFSAVFAGMSFAYVFLNIIYQN